VQHEHVPHARIDVDRKVCSVYICQMRKRLTKYGLKIKTLWGFGYQLSQEHRRKATEMILSRVALPALA
jgi:DNA-binding response OmpR family regulator